MQRILNKIELAKEQCRVGLISVKERDEMIAKLEFEMMGCDCM